MSSTIASRTIIGPLTTTFTPPPSCSSQIPQCAAGCANVFRAQSCSASGSGCADNSVCWPPASTGAPTPNQPYYGWGFYSPGLNCPVGYSTACSATGGGSQEFTFQFPLLSFETAVGCCPSGFSCEIDGYGHQTCVSSATSGTIPLATCSAGKLQIATTLMLPATQTIISGSSTATAAISEFSILAPLIDIRWQAKDLPSSSTSLPASASASTTAATASATTSPDPSPGGGLSVGAEVALGVCIPVAVIALIGGIYLILRRRKRSNKRDSAEGLPFTSYHDGHAAAPSERKNWPNTVVEETHDTTPLSEMPAERRVAEMAESSVLRYHELE